MSINGVTGSTTTGIVYDRSGRSRADGPATAPAAGRSAEAMRIEISPAARHAAAGAAVASANADAAASAGFFAAPGGLAGLPGVPVGAARSRAL